VKHRGKQQGQEVQQQSHTSSSAYLYDRLIRVGHSRLARHTIAGQDVTLSPF